MKKLLFTTSFVLISLISTRSFASTLTLRMFNNASFSLVFDNDTYKNLTGSFAMEDVSPGRHYLKVFRFKTTPDGEKFGMPRLVFEGFIRIRPDMAIYAVIDKYRGYVVENEVALTPPPVYVPPYMNDRDFSDLKASIYRLPFESSKLTLADQAAASNVLTSAQVFEIMQLFSFESSKLTFAEEAYKNAYDKNKYYIVNNAFTFSSSINALNDYIAQPK